MDKSQLPTNEEKEDSPQEYRMYRGCDQVLVKMVGEEEEIPVRMVWARPLTGRGREISVLHAKKKKEVLYIENIDAVAPEMKAIIEQELETRYLLPKIVRIVYTQVQFGNRYWEVETTHGPKHFVMKSPQTHVEWMTEDRCVLRDSMGNRYEIPSIAALDAGSRDEFERVL